VADKNFQKRSLAIKKRLMNYMDENFENVEDLEEEITYAQKMKNDKLFSDHTPTDLLGEGALESSLIQFQPSEPFSPEIQNMDSSP